MSVVEWNPHAARANAAATAANTETFLWDASGESVRLLASIQSHRRAVSDLNWSPFDANLLATCAADTFVNLWDVRDARNSLKLKSFCGYTAAATQVKWCRLNRMLLASAHAGDIRVWDVRRESAPLALITAHTLPIAGLDWSHVAASQLLSCSQDRSVKFWNIEQPHESRAQATLSVGAPLQRALFAPRGHAVATTAARDDCAVRLWTTPPLPVQPIHTCVGRAATSASPRHCASPGSPATPTPWRPSRGVSVASMCKCV